MPTDETPSTSSTTQSSRNYNFFSIPPPLKRLFDRTPLQTFEANTLPLRAPRRRDVHRLHIFVTEEGTKQGHASFNPSCLKWQAYLKFQSIDFVTASSNNHASPTGSLPFLIPSTSSAPDQLPISGSSLPKWCRTKAQHSAQSKPFAREQIYLSLIDTQIRLAWLYQLYLNPTNAPLCKTLYVLPCSSNALVKTTILHQLHHAAEQELVKGRASSVISETEVMQGAEEAFEALSTLLGADEWFFGEPQPGVFDASIFAYTHLLLSEDLTWTTNSLGELLLSRRNLVRHQERIVEMYF